MAQSRRRRRRKAKKKINLSRIFIFAFLALAVAVGVFSVSRLSTGNIYEKSDEKILKYIEKQTKNEIVFDNISVDGINIGGLTLEDVQNKLRKEIEIPESNVAAVISSGDDGKYKKEYTMEDFGIYFDLDGAIKAAYNFGKTGSEAEQLENFKSLENTPKNFQVMFYDEDKIRAVSDNIAKGINIAPVDSAVTHQNGQFIVSPSVVGYSMSADELYNALHSALIENRTFGETITFTITQTNPKYNEDDFKYIDNEIGSCYSRYKGGDKNRVTNLENGCNKIDGVVLYPDEVFSTNDHFNPCTYENGWRNAATIVKGKLEDSIGGGMCQVSSALYQAVLEAELEIVERFNHSMKVGYADYAYDATLAGDYKDLKFKNTTGYPMYIESYLTSSNVVVKLYGYDVHDSGHRVEFKNKFIKSTPPDEPKITEDNTKPLGYEEYTQSALDGKTYELYKYVYENGTLIDTVKINTSVYLPRRAEITKGTKEPEEVTETPVADDGTNANSSEQDMEAVESSDDVIVEETVF